MPRIRTIKPDFWTDQKIGALPRDARLLFIGLWNLADDQGVVQANPIYIKSQLCPYDEDLTVATVSQWLAAMQDARMLLPFTYSGSHYFLIRTFAEHQLINRPSKHKFPKQLLEELMYPSGNPHEGLIETSLHEGKGKEEEKEIEQEEGGNGNGGVDNAPPPPDEKEFLGADNIPHLGAPPAGAQTMPRPDTCEADAPLVLPWDTPAFAAAWSGWKDYRAKTGKPITPASEQAALLHISQLANGAEDMALQIITQSVANGWQGLFHLKNPKHEQPNPNPSHHYNSQQQHSRSAAQRLAARMADRLQRPAG